MKPRYGKQILPVTWHLSYRGSPVLLNIPLILEISWQQSEQNQHLKEMEQHTMPEADRVDNTK